MLIMIDGIVKITFEDILPIWRNNLWPSRISPIETHSAMLYLSTKYDMGNFLLPAWYLGYYVNDKLIGVNSGHLCIDSTVRSRGLWVDPGYRNNGFGKELLISTIVEARTHDAISVWSLPRKTSWHTYKSAGFILMSDWEQTETSEANAYCFISLI